MATTWGGGIGRDRRRAIIARAPPHPNRMNAHRYDLMYHVEDSHWWYRGMEAITRAVLDRSVGRGRGLRILDAGCGTGAVMGYLADYGSVTGCDYSSAAMHYSGLRRRPRLCRASVAALPFADGSFDVITSFDVL